jgi:hypothetical protein
VLADCLEIRICGSEGSSYARKLSVSQSLHMLRPISSNSASMELEDSNEEDESFQSECD